jgi:hypothetical protein
VLGLDRSAQAADATPSFASRDAAVVADRSWYSRNLAVAAGAWNAWHRRWRGRIRQLGAWHHRAGSAAFPWASSADDHAASRAADSGGNAESDAAGNHAAAGAEYVTNAYSRSADPRSAAGARCTATTASPGPRRAAASARAASTATAA